MKFKKFPEIETRRLYMRKMTVEDAPAVLSIYSDPLVVKDMGEEPLKNIDEAEEMITFMNDLFDVNKGFRWGIICKEDDILIGSCGYNSWETVRGSRGEIAYDLGRKYWRQGYMTETLKKMIEFGFYTMDLYRLEAFTNVDAIPSMNLLEKAGFRQDGILRGYASFHGQFCDQRVYSLIKPDWEKTK
ncbi:ribosomal-protein-alanine N-acetyltransferase [Fictibacillus solisalsi]|uniref:Ribosomal-protein-alanine N-acetyltransferase n=1 Tax=Fictibacillus solisalsi TaxID=459525 RepID=A0A1G9U3G5_9BACL|nr:GNAT family protein [Fictibacillus solisalsi]SDM54095.1 ribosomal-protein-alanine N-acetyltransferase [Fictibacillus solisalsi]